MRMFFLQTLQDWKLLRLKLQKYMEKVKVAAVALARRETSTFWRAVSKRDELNILVLFATYGTRSKISVLNQMCQIW